MYFAICGKNKDISLEELSCVKPENIKFYNNSFFTFDIDEKDLNKLYSLWWLIKWGRVVDFSELKDLLQDVKIIGTNDKWLWDSLKAEKIVRRYKTLAMQHADLEIKKKWKELIRIWSIIGLVMWYQNIWLYEDIDFGKPARSMQMGMMPAKLTHILVNMAIHERSSSPQVLKSVSWVQTSRLADQQTNWLLVYDPFVWSGTTWFLANFMWLDFIGSDKYIEYAKKNAIRWKNGKWNQNGKIFELFQQDIFKPLDVKERYLNSLVVVTEWWLWPIVTKNTTASQIKNFQQEVVKLYQAFLSNVSTLFRNNNIKLPVMVFTIPYYINHDNFLESDLKALATKLWRNFRSLDEVYQREGQNVGRKILIAS